MRRAAVCSLAVLALLAPVSVPSADEAVVCTDDPGSGGEWATYGGDLPASNNQHAEDRISPATVGDLELAWTITGATYQSKPIVAGRCMYYTDGGRVRAIDIETRAEVWTSERAIPGGGYEAFAVTVTDGRVHVNYEDLGKPKAAAFDADTGAFLWESEEILFGYPAHQLSSAVVFDGIHIIHTTGPDFDPRARPGYGLLDATDGSTLHKQTVIPEHELDDGYAGGGVWGTPAVDPVTKHAFVGTSNPKSKNKEHRYDNAIIKIDLDRSRSTFGQVVDAYKGQSDAIVDSGYNTPVCDLGGEDPIPGQFNVLCLQQDIDFGNGPTLWRNANGELMAAQIQKSGLMHAVYADTMTRAWTVQLGTHNWLTGTGGNHGQAANDGRRLYIASNPGLLWALDAATGRIEWVAPTAFPMQGMNVVVANGVVYSLDIAGIHAWDAETGMRLWEYPLPDAGAPCATTGSGITLAHHTLLVNCSRVYFPGTIAAFRLP